MNREELLAKKASGETLSAEEEAFLESSESSPEPTQPTNPPQDSAIDQRDRYIGLLEGTLREQNKQIQDLMNAPVRTAAPAPAAPDPEQEKTAFYNDPVNTTRKIIQDALKESIAPLQDFVRNLKGEGTPYGQMLARFKNDARFSQALNDPQVLAAVENIMSKTELTEINMQSAIVHAFGLKNMGLLGSPVQNGNNSPAPSASQSPTLNPSTVLPPHVRPSGPPAPAGNNGNGATKRPPLSENARRLMREQGFKSEDEYWTWMNMSAAEVASSELGRSSGGK